MQNQSALDETEYQWQPYRVTFPRFGLLLDHTGMHTRLIWPGQYLIRQSSTFSERIYRRRHW